MCIQSISMFSVFYYLKSFQLFAYDYSILDFKYPIEISPKIRISPPSPQSIAKITVKAQH